MRVNRPEPEVFDCLKSMLNQIPVGESIQLPITISALNRPRCIESEKANYLYSGADPNYLIENYSESILLLGAPGVGKTHRLRNYAREKIMALIQGEILETPIPVYLELRRYEGSLSKLLEQRLGSCTLKPEMDSGKVIFLLDGFNEIPSRFNSEMVEADLSEWMSKTPRCRWTISSRTAEGLDFFNAMPFGLDLLDSDFVVMLLRSYGLEVRGRYEKQLLTLLRKPLLLQAAINGRIPIGTLEETPANVFESLLRSYVSGITDKIAYPNIVAGLGRIAVQAVDAGDEIFSEADLFGQFESEYAAIPRSLVTHLIKGLLNSGLILQYGVGRFAFFHQAITDWLAGRYLSGQIADPPSEIIDLLRNTRWHEAVSHMPSYWNASETIQVIKTVAPLGADPTVMILKMSSAIEPDLVRKLLEHVSSSTIHLVKHDFEAYSDLPVSEEHEPIILDLLRDSDAWKAALGGRLLSKILGLRSLDIILTRLALPASIQLGEIVGGDLANDFTPEHLTELLIGIDKLESIDPASHWSYFKLVTGLLANLDSKTVFQRFKRMMSNPLVSEISAHFAAERACELSAKWLIDLVASVDPGAIFPAYLSFTYGRPTCRQFATDLDKIEAERVSESLFSLVVVENPKITMEYALGLIGSLISLNRDAHQYFSEKSEALDGITRLGMLALLGSSHRSKLLVSVRHRVECRTQSYTQFERDWLFALEQVQWAEYPDLVFAVLESRDHLLLWPMLRGQEIELGFSLNFDWLVEQLHWLHQLGVQGGGGNVSTSLAWLFVKNMDPTARKSILQAFSNSTNHLRTMMMDCWLLLYLRPFDLGDFSLEAIEFLIDGLSLKDCYVYSSVISSFATVQFVESDLCARMGSGTPIFQSNLRDLIRQLGRDLDRCFDLGESVEL